MGWALVMQPFGPSDPAALPEVGDEVVVGFLNGDPDRPIVTGRVYHGER